MRQLAAAKNLQRVVVLSLGIFGDDLSKIRTNGVLSEILLIIKISLSSLKSFDFIRETPVIHYFFTY